MRLFDLYFLSLFLSLSIPMLSPLPLGMEPLERALLRDLILDLDL